MQKIHLSTFIKAPRERVWDVMLQDATYRTWTAAFMPGSYYQGSWDQGSSIRFLGPNPDGTGEGGVLSRIAESRRPEYVSIEHLGWIKNGVEDVESEEVQPWKGAHENYTFREKDGGTELVIDVDTSEKERAYMEDAWKKGLEILKSLAEA